MRLGTEIARSTIYFISANSTRNSDLKFMEKLRTHLCSVFWIMSTLSFSAIIQSMNCLRYNFVEMCRQFLLPLTDIVSFLEGLLRDKIRMHLFYMYYLSSIFKIYFNGKFSRVIERIWNKNGMLAI